MELNGLSLDQAPPISAPLRFFLTAPLFGIVAGFLILFSDGATLSSRFSYEAIAITHAITIGFIAFVMLGALTQMLPVLAGVRIPKVGFIVKYAHILLVIGTLSMIAGFLSSNQLFYIVALFGLGIGFLMMIVTIGLAIKSVTNFTPTVRGMAVSVMFAFFIVLMGLHLLASHVSGNISEYQLVISNVHSVWAVFGFGGMLIIGVAFQVLPMFYVAPRFKNFCKKRVVWLISIGLFLWLFLNFFYDVYSGVAIIWIAIFFWAFATTVWKKLNARRRPISDVTVWYWRVASFSLTIGSFLWVFDEYFSSQHIVLVAIIIGGGFLLSIIVGMLYKIVPFLVWFHLNAMGYMNIPTMNEMIDKRLAKAQFFLFIISLIGFSISFFIPSVLAIFALTFIASMIILEYNIVTSVMVYVKTKKTKPDFDMSAFTTT